MQTRIARELTSIEESLKAPMNTILIVDDSPTIRRMVKASLGMLPGVMFLEAESGLQAIEALAVSSVQTVVLDLNMPDMHGLDVLRFVRSHDQYKDVPVMVLTTRGDATSRDTALQAGASAYMTKPFSPPALAAAVNELITSVRGRGVSLPTSET
jgi:two-component system, chemotaxis family, chemotaxis protein CheY